MKDRPTDPPLPPWIEHGPLPRFVREELWAENNRANQFVSSELNLRAHRSFDGHPYAIWGGGSRWDLEHVRSGDVLYIVSPAPLDDVLPPAASQGFVERHRERLADGVVRAELLISFMYQPPQRRHLQPHDCQMQVWLGDTPLIRSVLERRTPYFELGWMVVPDEDRALLSLAYENPASAADIIARDRDRDRKIQHASLDERARSFGLDATLAEARALAEQIPFY